MFCYISLEYYAAHCLEQEQRVHSPNLAAGVTSESDKINILTSGDSSRLEVYAYLPRGDSI